MENTTNEMELREQAAESEAAEMPVETSAEDAPETEAKAEPSAEAEQKSAPEETVPEEEKPARKPRTRRTKAKEEANGPVQTKKANIAMPENTRKELIRNTSPKSYIRDGSKVFTQDVKTKYEAEMKNLDPAMARLVSAFQNQRYLTVKVSGTRNDERLGACAVCFYGDEMMGETVYTILIPFGMFTETTEKELEQLGINKNIFLERRIGSYVDFLPEDYKKDGDEYTFIGNRVKAMMICCYEEWFSKIKSRGPEDEYRFKVGSFIEARIVGKFPRRGIRVECFGVEYTIPIQEISWMHIPRDLSTVPLDVGDNVNICITRLRRDAAEGTVSYEASIRKTMRDPRLAAFDRIRIGDSYHGIITNVLFVEDDIEKSRIFIKLDGGGEAMCAKFDEYNFKEGDRVSVRIGNKYISDEGEPRLEAFIKHVFESTKKF